MDDIVPGTLKTFDAFPKVSSTYSVRSTRGGFVTILLAISCLFLIWVEMAQYLGGEEHHQFSVDGSVAQAMQINLDITVNMPCNTILINVIDASDDIILVSELMNFQSTSLDLSSGHLMGDRPDAEGFHGVLKHAKRSKFKGRIPVENGDSCRLYGSFPVNKVQGELRINARGIGLVDRYTVKENDLNFTHVIDEFSFGELYPKLVNPLDGVFAVAEHKFETFQYFMSVVPTTYKSFSTGRVVATNQYAVKDQAGVTNHDSIPPGIMFKYDVEPIALTITDERMPFLQFLVRLINIIGGLVVCTSWIYQLIERVVFRKGQESELGVLDELTEATEQKSEKAM